MESQTEISVLISFTSLVTQSFNTMIKLLVTFLLLKSMLVIIILNRKDILKIFLNLGRNKPMNTIWSASEWLKYVVNLLANLFKCHWDLVSKMAYLKIYGRTTMLFTFTKKVTNKNLKNYRTVLFLATCGNIFEWLIYHNLFDFLIIDYVKPSNQ